MTDSRALDLALNDYERTKLWFCNSMSDYLSRLDLLRLDIRTFTNLISVFNISVQLT